jgi:hypothetical protein
MLALAATLVLIPMQPAPKARHPSAQHLSSSDQGKSL